MLKRFLKTVLLLSVLGAGAACTPVGQGDDISTPITAAVSISFSDVSANTAVMTISSAQEEVVSLLVSPPTPKSSVSYIEMDAAGRLEWINTNGSAQTAPFETTLSGLAAGSTYVVGALGLDASGKVITAPTFSEVSTGLCSVELSVRYVDNGDGTVTFTGDIVPNANTGRVDYIFSVEDAALSTSELEEKIKAKGSSVKSTTTLKSETIANTTSLDVVLAAIPYDALGNPGTFAASFASASKEDRYSVIVGSNEIKMTKSGDIYEATVDFPAGESTFTIEVNRVPYGFLSYSGNGGIGTVRNIYSAAPYYNYVEGHDIYPASKSVGQMGKIEEGAHEFWYNETSACKVLVRVDASKDVPRYYFENKKAKDASIVLDQSFDLYVWGGNYADPIKGTSPLSSGQIPSGSVINYDGTEPGFKDACSSTAGGTDIYSYGGSATMNLANDTYIANRDMVGWEILNMAEMPGHVRISKSSAGYQGYLKTPGLTSLSAPTNVVLTFDCGRFGNNTGKFLIRIEGSGTFSAAEYEAAADGYKTADASGTEFEITAAICPSYANAYTNKPWTHVKLSITGASSDTKIVFDGTQEASASASRLRLDNVLIKK